MANSDKRPPRSPRQEASWQGKGKNEIGGWEGWRRKGESTDPCSCPAFELSVQREEILSRSPIQVCFVERGDKWKCTWGWRKALNTVPGACICLIIVLMSSLPLAKWICGHPDLTKAHLLKLTYIQQTCAHVYRMHYLCPFCLFPFPPYLSCLSLLPWDLQFLLPFFLSLAPSPHFLSNLQ